MKLLFIKYAPTKKPELFLLLNDNGTNLMLLKHAAMDKSEIPLIRAALSHLRYLPINARMGWFRKLRSWNLAFRKFTKTKVTIIREYPLK